MSPRVVPPASIQLRGRAELLDWTDPEGTEHFRRSWLGRRILAAYERSRRRGETRVCFLRVTPDPIARTYGVGHSVWALRRRMEAAAGMVVLPTAPAAAPGHRRRSPVVPTVSRIRIRAHGLRSR